MDYDFFRRKNVERVDPYVTVHVADINETNKAHRANNCRSPTFNHKLLLTCKYPCLSDYISIDVNDDDTAGRDDLITSTFLPLSHMAPPILTH